MFLPFLKVHQQVLDSLRDIGIVPLDTVLVVGGFYGNTHNKNGSSTPYAIGMRFVDEIEQLLSVFGNTNPNEMLSVPKIFQFSLVLLFNNRLVAVRKPTASSGRATTGRQRSCCKELARWRRQRVNLRINNRIRFNHVERRVARNAVFLENYRLAADRVVTKYFTSKTVSSVSLNGNMSSKRVEP